MKKATICLGTAALLGVALGIWFCKLVEKVSDLNFDEYWILEL